MYNRRILVIDDDPDILATYRNILVPDYNRGQGKDTKHLGRILGTDSEDEWEFAVEAAAQGTEGYGMVLSGLAEDNPFALAFIDIRIPPGWDGIETAARIRKADPNIELVIVTAYADRSLKEIVGPIGSPEKLILLRKPFDPEEIIQLAFSLTEKWNLARQEELRRIELQSILKMSPAAIFTLDRNRIITSWNVAAEQITGYGADEVVGRPCIYQRVAQDQQCQKCALDFDYPDRREIQNREINIIDKAGQSHTVSKSISYLRDNQGRVVQAIESFWDISPLKEAHAKLVSETGKRKNLAKEAAVLEERSRLARELHDSVTQSLYSVSLLTETARHLVASGDLDGIGKSLAELNDTVQEILKEMRLLIYNLRPEVLKTEGFSGAVQQRLDSVESRSGIRGEFILEGGGELTEPEEDTFYRIIQEALNNTLKHSSASSVQVRMTVEDDSAELRVTDDGIGFETAVVADRGGMGLIGIQERAEHLDGTFSLQSSSGTGTRLRVTIPREIAAESG